MTVFTANVWPANSDALFDDEPRALQVDLSQERADRIRQLAAFVTEHGLRKVEMFDASPVWLNEMPDQDLPEEIQPAPEPSKCPLEFPTLHICATEFWYTARLKHSEVAFESTPLPIESLPIREPITEDWCAHEWVYTGTAYGGDDESYRGEGRCYCKHCGADGDG